MYLLNSNHQPGLHPTYRADGTLASSTTPQLILPRAETRAYLMVMNTSAAPMWLNKGGPTATATISAGVVNAVTVVNGGFGYTIPPIIEFVGGGPGIVVAPASAAWTGYGFSGTPPTGLAAQGASGTTTYNRPAAAHCVLTSGKVSSIVIDDGGFGYINPPNVVIYNHPNDPFGCADPSTLITGSIYSGIYIGGTNGTFTQNGTFCTTDPLALFGTAGSPFVVEYAT